MSFFLFLANILPAVAYNVFVSKARSTGSDQFYIMQVLADDSHHLAFSVGSSEAKSLRDSTMTLP